jgi:ABC-type transport system involved in cytochrome c biogenesis permease subunit
LFWFSLALYIAATVLYAYQFVLKRPKVGYYARFHTGAGFICQTLSIGANSLYHGTTQLTGANQLMLASWALVLLYFIMEHLIKIKIYGAFLIPVAVFFMGASQVLAALDPASNQLMQDPLLRSGLVAFHVGLIVFANAGFVFGAVSSGIYLFQEGKLKTHTSNIVTRRLPSLTTLQSIARRAILFSFPVYTAGLLLGILRAVSEQVDQWWFDPRIMLSGIIWLVFGAYLVLVYRQNVSSRTSSWVAVFGFVLVMIVAILARTVPIGFHVFGR